MRAPSPDGRPRLGPWQPWQRAGTAFHQGYARADSRRVVAAIAVGAAESASPNFPFGNYASTGHTYTCAVSDARLYCWGWNTYGQLGHPFAGRSEKDTRRWRNARHCPRNRTMPHVSTR